MTPPDLFRDWQRARATKQAIRIATARFDTPGTTRHPDGARLLLINTEGARLTLSYDDTGETLLLSIKPPGWPAMSLRWPLTEGCLP